MNCPITNIGMFDKNSVALKEGDRVRVLKSHWSNPLKESDYFYGIVVYKKCFAKYVIKLDDGMSLDFADIVNKNNYKSLNGWNEGQENVYPFIEILDSVKDNK